MIVAYYSTATGWHHQVTRLDPGEQPRATRAGEGMQVVDPTVFNAWLAQWKGSGDRDPIQEYLNTVTGITPQPCQYAVVQNGVVVNIMGKIDPVLHAADVARELVAWPNAAAVVIPGNLAVAIGATWNVLTGFTNPIEQIITKALVGLGL